MIPFLNLRPPPADEWRADSDYGLGARVRALAGEGLVFLVWCAFAGVGAGLILGGCCFVTRFVK